ncbi:MAG: hypothetical protein N0C88_07700 [Candidatus Thiodiazotropha lotti]|uniref:Uncharacterized protein n=1 Tax=Candidatus Thiodiazotropha lotti TaxID=2792787 RepID=A0A9E4K4H6_9GAMM|nr:hypothetical protein [Candidatus Thiodiazotropha lotti]MCW4203195.1 hypothetical protein [Candidatus Thiodiazotropha lotti]
MNNNMMGSLVGQLGQAIQCAPGIPQFARDEMRGALKDIQQSCPPEPTPPGCQRDTDDAMSGLIDKIVEKVVDQIMEKLQGGGCQPGGSFQDMVRQAIEDVVRETIGGGSEDGGCAANGGATSSGGTDGSEKAGGNSDCTAPSPMEMEDDSEGKKAKTGNWLVALAQAMAEISGQHLKNMIQAQADMQENMGDGGEMSTSEQQEQSQKFNEAQGRFQAESKMFSMVSEATSTALKSIGDGLASLARKQ